MRQKTEKRENTVGPLSIGHTELRSFCTGALEKVGVPKGNAFTVADSLVAASLRGVDSHGVELLPGYIQQLRNGGVHASTSGEVISVKGGTMIYDGADGLGQVVSSSCCTHAAKLAQKHGISIVVARNSHHFGAAAYWSQSIAKEGLIGIAMSTAGPGVAPWQGKTPCIGTNPISIALPGNAGGKWLLDMATTTVAKGKIATATSEGKTVIPESWAFVDIEGNPTTDRLAAQTGWSLPLGGYKGTGLAMMVELLCAGLSGGPMAREVPINRDGRVPLKVSHTFLAIEVSPFLSLSDLNDRTGSLVRMMKSSELRKGFDEVIVAGEPEQRTEAVRREHGIPIARSLWERLSELGLELDVPFHKP
jgi:LDH2 family malate/lactate/ureidoglycolate dehydrogenase